MERMTLPQIKRDMRDQGCLNAQYDAFSTYLMLDLSESIWNALSWRTTRVSGLIHLQAREDT